METVDAIIIGAGLGGLRALYSLRGRGLSVTVLEASDELGGVWNFNRYPGARCDVESYDYSYAGENLAMDFHSAEKMEDAWMKSPTHRANILNEKYKDIGVAVKAGNQHGGRASVFGTSQQGCASSPA